MKLFSDAEDVSQDNCQIGTAFGMRLFQTSKQAKAMVNDELRIVKANTSFFQETGYALVESDELSIYDLPFASSPNFEQLVGSIVAGTLKYFDIENNYCAANGSVKTLNYRVEGSYDNNQFVGALITLTNVTRERQRLNAMQNQLDDLQDKYNQLKRQLDESPEAANFAHIASHDMKEPLRMIGNFSQLIARKYSNILDESGKEYLGYVLSGVQNMNDMITDLVGYGELDKAPHLTQEIEIDKMIELVIHQNRLDPSKIEIGSLPSTIKGDRNKIKQLFQCILDNAHKFKHAERALVVKINCEEKVDHWKFTIKDNGIGIDDVYYDRVFSMFKKLHSKSDYKGSGIGLAICKKIVNHHNGKIWVDSVVGVGSTFYFTLAK